MRIAPFLLLALVASVAQAHPLVSGLVGTWELISRTDRDSTGHVISETSLGALPIGYLTYDATGHVAAQLSARDRSTTACDSLDGSPDPNNNANISGYSAYFGRYTVDTKTGIVTHIVTGTLAPADMGKKLWRHFKVKGDTLTIWFEPLGPDGVPRERTLIWHRAS